MAASNKNTGLHVGLAFSIMGFLIMSAAWYMSFKEFNESSAKWVQTDADLKASEKLLRDRIDEIDDLKARIGHLFDSVGLGDENNESTVLGRMVKDIRDYAPNPQEPTYAQAIIKLRQELNNVSKERDALKADLDNEHKALLALQGQYQGRADQFDTARKTAETELSSRITKFDEEITAKNNALQNARDELEQVKVEFAAADEAHEKEAQKLQQDKKFLVDANDRLREKLDEATNVSFEQPDGVIRTVDNTTGLVWINRGSADSLSKRTTFSVYTKGHHGVARGGEDIKGAIEVTRIIGAHLAEARILSDDIFAPITPGDPIYTPLWSPGRKQIFSFAGLMDLDQDKVSDRKLLRELVAAAGAEIDNEIDDEGNRTGDGITINTKFLVIGEMPDPSEEVNLDEKARMSKILEEFKRLREEARRQGVRVVNLNDFLSFIGYKPQRRTWVPGMKIPWNLSAGAHSASLKSKVGDRSSSGQVSGAYTRSKRLLQQKSSGQTSRLFRGGAKGGY